MTLLLRFIISALCALAVTSFSPIACTTTTSCGKASALQMGFFDQLFGGGKTATASHILIKGPKAVQECEQLRDSIYKAAIGRGNPNDGVQAEKLMQAFATAAASKSACPSAKSGGSLGSFGPGQMVAAFDKVVFNEAVGVIHGPVQTQFGSHLILITERE